MERALSHSKKKSDLLHIYQVVLISATLIGKNKKKNKNSSKNKKNKKTQEFW